MQVPSTKIEKVLAMVIAILSVLPLQIMLLNVNNYLSNPNTENDGSSQ